MIAEDLRNEADYEIESYQIERGLEND
jgi:hypothetical protein